VLEGKLQEQDIEDVKETLAKAYANRQNVEEEHLAELGEDVIRQAEENQRLKTEVEVLQQRIRSGATAVNGIANGGVNGKTIQQQIADFDAMKKSLMRDLQNRCERVVELEISLDETREQYNNVLRTSNNRAQQKKMAFLERNLEQLTVVQRQLVEQNSSLKKEVAIAERKLIARNERIQSLESLLQDKQEQLTQANHRLVVFYTPTLAHSRFADTTFTDSRPNSLRSRSVWKQRRLARLEVLAHRPTRHSLLVVVQELQNPFVVEVVA
jgi:kinesin family protein 5